MSNLELQSISSRWEGFNTRELNAIFQGYVDEELRIEVQTELRRRYAQSLD